MRPLNRLDSTVRCALLLGTLVLVGCVPSGFVYDLPQDRYYSSGSRYYSAGTPGYDGQPYYYGQPGQYPRVIYVDHDHDRDDCRHESHRDRRDDRNDRDRRDAPADRQPAPRAPRGVTPKDPAQTARPDAGRNTCASGKKCGPSAQTTEADAPRRRTETREGSRLVAQ
jgi:hypothetical protein